MQIQKNLLYLTQMETFDLCKTNDVLVFISKNMN
jgi:hypothetical protein